MIRSEECLQKWVGSPEYEARRQAEAQLMDILEGRVKYPDGSGKTAKGKLTIGDIIEIPLCGNRKAFGHYVLGGRLIGYLIQVFSYVCQNEASPPLGLIVASGPLFPLVAVQLRWAVESGMWRVIGNAPVGEITHPVFRSRFSGEHGIIKEWWLFDGVVSRRVGKLPPGGENYEYHAIWSPQAFVRRIETGENPYEYRTSSFIGFVRRIWDKLAKRGGARG